MSRTIRRAIGLGAVAVAGIALVGAGGATALGGPRAHPALASTPHLKITMSKKHTTMTGPRTFRAGRVAISLTSIGKEHEIEVASLKKGYTFADVRADLTAFGSKQGKGPHGSTSKAALKHLNRVIKNTNLYGGLDSVAGQTLRGTVVLPTAGTYFVTNDSGGVPSHPMKLTVTGPAVKRAAPPSTATVTALTTRRFGGAKKLPAKGTITFKNKSTESPHFLDLQHVKQGTTAKQVLAVLTGPPGPPSFARKGSAGIDTVGEGHAMTLTYKLPPGEYVELCFFPDPKTGMPHALMGMIGIVQLT